MTRVLQISELRKDGTVGVGDEFIINKQLVDGYDSRVILGSALGPGLANLSKVSDLSDVSILTPAVGQALVWTGVEWAPGNVSGGGPGGGNTLEDVLNAGNTANRNILLGSGSPYKITLSASDGSISSGPILASAALGGASTNIFGAIANNTQSGQPPLGAVYYLSDGSLGIYDGSPIIGQSTVTINKKGLVAINGGQSLGSANSRLNITTNNTFHTGLEVVADNSVFPDSDAITVSVSGNTPKFTVDYHGNVSGHSLTAESSVTANNGKSGIAADGTIFTDGKADIEDDITCGTKILLDASSGDISTTGSITAGNFVGNVEANAASADKLSTTHTFWGQDFNGTQNVAGNISNTQIISSYVNEDLTLRSGNSKAIVIGGVDSPINANVQFLHGDTGIPGYFFGKKGSNTIFGNFVFDDLTASVSYRFPNKAGTVALLSDVSGSPIEFKAVVNLTTDTAPASPEVGDMYLNNATGTIDNSWTGVGGDPCTPATRVIWDGNEWEISEENTTSSQWVTNGNSLYPVNAATSVLIGGTLPLQPTVSITPQGVMTLSDDVGSSSNLQLDGPQGNISASNSILVGSTVTLNGTTNNIGGVTTFPNVTIDDGEVTAETLTLNDGAIDTVTISTLTGYSSSLPITLSDSVNATVVTATPKPQSLNQSYLGRYNVSTGEERAFVATPDQGTTESISLHYDGSGEFAGTITVGTETQNVKIEGSTGITINEPAGTTRDSVMNVNVGGTDVFTITPDGNMTVSGTLNAGLIEGTVEANVENAKNAENAVNSTNCLRQVIAGVGLLDGGQLVSDITLNCKEADEDNLGVVMLENSTQSTDTSKAATAASVNAVYNYVSTYAPSVTGENATGTWNISIAGGVEMTDLAPLP